MSFLVRQGKSYKEGLNIKDLPPLRRMFYEFLKYYESLSGIRWVKYHRQDDHYYRVYKNNYR